MLYGCANGKEAKHFPCDSSFVQDAENIFGKFQKHFLLPRRRFCVFNICCVGQQTRNHLGNTEETLTLNVSQMFPRLGTQATYLEDAEFASRKQKCFASFPFAHPYNIVSKINSKMFLQQCFLVVLDNVSLFAPALRIIILNERGLEPRTLL